MAQINLFTYMLCTHAPEDSAIPPTAPSLLCLVYHTIFRVLLETREKSPCLHLARLWGQNLKGGYSVTSQHHVLMFLMAVFLSWLPLLCPLMYLMSKPQMLLTHALHPCSACLGPFLASGQQCTLVL